MDFYDPEGEPILTPQEMVKALSWGRFLELRVQRWALVVVTPYDLKALVRKLKGKPHRAWWPYRKVYRAPLSHGTITLALCPFGAPNAVALAEELLAFGMSSLLFFGYCGSLKEEVRVGDLLIPEGAVREEGTSYHYLPPGEEVHADPELVGLLEGLLREEGVDFHRGKVWTTDALYRETSSKVRRYAAEGCLGVEMEVAALFAWGRSKGARVGVLLVVSDGFSSGRWSPGFRSPRFFAARRRALGLMARAAERAMGLL